MCLSKPVNIIPAWQSVEKKRKRTIILSGSCLENTWSVNVADVSEVNIETSCIQQEMPKPANVFFLWDTVADNYLSPFYI